MIVADIKAVVAKPERQHDQQEKRIGPSKMAVVEQGGITIPGYAKKNRL